MTLALNIAVCHKCPESPIGRGEKCAGHCPCRISGLSIHLAAAHDCPLPEPRFLAATGITAAGKVATDKWEGSCGECGKDQAAKAWPALFAGE